jgi:hypothetical protein
LKSAIAGAMAFVAVGASAADEPPRGDGFEFQALAYVLTELESCASLGADLRGQYDDLLLKAPGMKSMQDEFRSDPHYEAFRRDIARRRASVPEDVVQAECRLMLSGISSQAPR